MSESTKSGEFIYLTQEDVLAAGLDMARAIGIVETVLALHDAGEVNLPSKVVLDLGERERGRINAMPAYVGGAFNEEEEAVVFNADKVVVDIWEEVLHRGTPLLARLFRAGRIDDTRIHANLGAIVRGTKKGREHAVERIFFSPMGLGSEDVAVASVVYREARRKGIGVPLKLWDKPCL